MFMARVRLFPTKIQKLWKIIYQTYLRNYFKNIQCMTSKFASGRGRGDS